MTKQMTKDELRNKIDELWDDMSALWEEVDTWNRRYDDCLWFNDPERAKKAKAEVDKRMAKIIKIDKERNALCNEGV